MAGRQQREVVVRGVRSPYICLEARNGEGEQGEREIEDRGGYKRSDVDLLVYTAHETLIEGMKYTSK